MEYQEGFKVKRRKLVGVWREARKSTEWTWRRKVLVCRECRETSAGRGQR